jgi:AcrR family transcriptional regulator
MEPKGLPLQERSRQTFEAILHAAGTLLAEVGVEKFSTNLVCKRAGLTPPALYRYFPNKYALLKALGARLMEVQDAAAYEWIEQGGLDGRSVPDMAAKHLHVLQRMVEITEDFPGGPWILRAMNAVPMMRECRQLSVDAVARRIFDHMAKQEPSIDSARWMPAIYLTTGLSMTVVEMVLETPAVERDALLVQASLMNARYFAGLLAE